MSYVDDLFDALDADETRVRVRRPKADNRNVPALHTPEQQALRAELRRKYSKRWVEPEPVLHSRTTERREW